MFASSVWSGRFLALLRIMASLDFMQHGCQKLFGLLGGVDGHGGTVPIGSLMGAAGILETFGGALLLLGLFTRPAAFILAGEMAVAYFTQHFPHSFFPVVNHGEPAVLFCFIFLLVAVAGPGAFSLDGLLWPRSWVTRPQETERSSTTEQAPTREAQLRESARTRQP